MRSSLIRSTRVLTPGGMHAASVHILDGKIARIAEWSNAPADAELHDAGDNVVMPGIVDTHVHVNEPGRTEWEGFASATRSAAAGGITTLLDMPLNSIPATTTVYALETKREAARGKTLVNVEYIGGVVPGNVGDLKGLVDAGVRAFKCFLTPSGVDEFQNVTEADLRIAFPFLAKLGVPLMVHAEDPALIRQSVPSRKYSDYLVSRPVEAEHSAIRLMVRLMEWCPTPVHIVHLSSATSLDIVREARAKGLPLTVETCPHYLTFAAEEIPDGATEYKCAPPIRSAAEREALWDALIAGDIDLVASDHSPCLPSLKETGGDFSSSWGGIASLQYSLAGVWTGAKARGVPIDRVSNWMSAATSRFAGLDGAKGRLAAGYDADIIIWDPEAKCPQQRGKQPTPYDGRNLWGQVMATYVAGQK
ncbi:MAG TPA: allantoinase AllB, partial [Gemmatimonadaceae bacterium]|nr:allantoinase AllB [Gemmatimonadaceae bacterium]